ncbi:MAG TPA: ammonia-forming cytochrome c nitrite reductase subunit c552 [Symbiobacteriaceae bacterium]|nr:ammonia-forming cytochrome c nitrite reductase subunit c552 [Symbiobacteriaceae bacterium]
MKKALKIAMLLGMLLVLVLAAGVVVAEKKAVPEYVGSQTCLACHADRWSSWAGSHHAAMVLPINGPSDIPGFDKATEEQKAELLKADFVVSGGRFLAKDHATGKLEFLKYEYNHVEGYWFDYDEPGSVWQDRCMGCHVTPAPKTGTGNEPDEFGIGCEACHGPGRDHITAKGDISKIIVNPAADVCGQCHNSGFRMADGTRWPVGYSPANKLTELTGVTVPKAIDTTATANRGHHKTFNEWLVSGHGPKAVADLKANDHASGSCYACHTQEGYSAKQHEEEFVYDATAEYVAISCVTCHRPHSLNKAVDEKTMCASCHNGSIPEGGSLKPGATPHHPMKEMFAGYGAAGDIKATKENFHKEVACQECHMANNNHLMQVVNPGDPNLAEGSDDGCTICHKESTREARAGYLEMWHEVTSGKINALKADIAAIEAAVKGGTTMSADLKLKFDTAKTNVLFVEADGSMGAHNFDYAAQILTAAQKDLSTVKAEVVK